MGKPRIFLVSPALAAANNGNWHTAARWRDFLEPVADTEIAQEWRGEPADALIALHARRSADSVARFAATRRPLAVVLTGTDLYRDIDEDAAAQHSLECATGLVVLQPQGLQRLSPAHRAKARAIVQSAERVEPAPRAGGCRFVAVGHLREEKDPATLLQAVRRLQPEAGFEIVHIGAALDPVLGALARQTAADCPHYRWLGALAHAETRNWIARASALVHPSRIEGGANVVIEAVRSAVPVLASRIDGNVGLLGSDYDGYFPAGDSGALAGQMRRFCDDSAFADRLRAQCALVEPGLRPEVEAAAVRTLVADLLAGRGPTLRAG